ncbi:MAG: 2OG-Fe(II) oxygenase [Burkholderiales bacterium]|nr:2OG-Fe(II) oxygenase [Burkholderiales bacterium]
MQHIDFDSIEGKIETLATTFRNARPFEYVVIENFLKEDSLTTLLNAIPKPDNSKKSSDYLFAKNKYEDPTFASRDDILTELREELLGQRFSEVLSKIMGKTLFVDPLFVGGGIHQGGEGSFLDMHADFSRHPAHKEWLRELNILLYLNKNYKEEYGGHLELEHAQTHERGRIAPALNRLVLMLTKEHTLHGYKPINFPAGTYRTSLAAYAYSIDSDFEGTPQRSTVWKPEDASGVKTALAAVSPYLVKVKNTLFGSSTVRRANEQKTKK